MRKLYLDNGDQKFKFSDTTTEIHLNTFENGIETIPTADAKVRIKNESGYLMEISTSIRDNHAVFTSGQLARLPVGSYLIELWDNVKGGTAVYPSDGFLALQINENVTGLSGGIISSITVDDFVQQFNGLGKQLKKEVADAVDNGVKGDTGPQGPQGTQGPRGPRGPAGEDGTQVDLTEYAKTTDVTTAISTATANMADLTKPSNFTNGLQSGGVDVATAADLKSIEDQAWYLTTLPTVGVIKNMHMLYKVDNTNSLLYIVLNGTYVSATSSNTNGLLAADLKSIVKGISGANILSAGTSSDFYCYDVNFKNGPSTGSSMLVGYSGTKLMIKSPYPNAPMIESENGTDFCIEYGSTITYTDLV